MSVQPCSLRWELVSAYWASGPPPLWEKLLPKLKKKIQPLVLIQEKSHSLNPKWNKTSMTKWQEKTRMFTKHIVTEGQACMFYSVFLENLVIFLGISFYLGKTALLFKESRYKVISWHSFTTHWKKLCMPLLGPDPMFEIQFIYWQQKMSSNWNQLLWFTFKALL